MPLCRAESLHHICISMADHEDGHEWREKSRHPDAADCTCDLGTSEGCFQHDPDGFCSYIADDDDEGYE